LYGPCTSARGCSSVERKQTWMDPGFESVTGSLIDCQEFDSISEFGGIFDVVAGYVPDPLDMDIFIVDPRIGDNGAYYSQFLGGVVSVDIEGGIGLGKPELLGLFEHDIEIEFLPLHAGEDIVAGAVEYGHGIGGFVGDQGFL